MSKTQRTVIAVLGTAVFLVMGCLVCLAGSLWRKLPQLPGSPPAAGTPTPRASATPTRQPSSGDKEYADCYLAFGDDVLELMNDISFTCDAGMQDPSAFCAHWAAGDYTARAQRMVSMHNRCPRPISSCMVLAQRLMSQALDEFAAGTSRADEWCRHGSLSDLTLLRASAEHAVLGQRYIEQATDAVQSCPWY